MKHGLSQTNEINAVMIVISCNVTIADVCRLLKFVYSNKMSLMWQLTDLKSSA